MAKKKKEKAVTYGQVFWTWYNYHAAERQRKAEWAYDLVSKAEHSKEKTVELLTDLIFQAERRVRQEASEVADRHEQTATKYAILDMETDRIYKHLSDCAPCMDMALKRYEYLNTHHKGQYSDKCPWKKD